jgi:hypothetical protein
MALAALIVQDPPHAAQSALLLRYKMSAVFPYCSGYLVSLQVEVKLPIYMP